MTATTDSPPDDTPEPEQARQPPLEHRQTVPFAIAFEASLIGLALVLGHVFEQPPLEFCELDGRGVGLGLLATLPMLGLLALLLVAPGAPFRRLREAWDKSLAPVFHDWSVWEVASLALVAGVGEELLFRGVIQLAAARWLGVLGGCLVASVLFGLPHAITLTYAVITAAIGGYLGWLLLASGNLLVPIVAHAVYDFLALQVLRYGWRKAAQQKAAA